MAPTQINASIWLLCSWPDIKLAHPRVRTRKTKFSPAPVGVAMRRIEVLRKVPLTGQCKQCLLYHLDGIEQGTKENKNWILNPP